MTSTGEQRLFTSSSAEFTLLFCAQATSEELGEVLVVDKDESKRLRRDGEAVSGPGECSWVGTRAVPFGT